MSVIVGWARLSYVAGMSRLLFALLIGLAMLLAPPAIRDGSAMAMAPAASGHARMSHDGHCDQAPAEDPNGKSVDQSNCAAMCTAIALASASALEPLALAKSVERPSPAKLGHGFQAELPTPPPRLA